MNNIEKLWKIAELLKKHLKHASSCSTYLPDSNPESDYCSCNLRQHIQESNTLFKELLEDLNG